MCFLKQNYKCPFKVIIFLGDRVYIVAYQAHPALVKTGLILAGIFHFNSLLVRTRGLTARESSRPGAKADFLRPRPTGTLQYNIYL